MKIVLENVSCDMFYQLIYDSMGFVKKSPSWTDLAFYVPPSFGYLFSLMRRRTGHLMIQTEKQLSAQTGKIIECIYEKIYAQKNE